MRDLVPIALAWAGLFALAGLFRWAHRAYVRRLLEPGRALTTLETIRCYLADEEPPGDG